MSDMREQVQKKKPRLALRFVLFSIVFALSAIAVLVQYGLVMLSPEQAKERLATRLSERGPILDRNGRILAMQTRLANISIWRPEIQDLPLFAGALAPLLELDAGELEARIKDSASDFIYAKKQVDQTVIQSVEEAIRAGKLKGAGIEPVVGRIYPEKNLASQLIGFVGDSNEGFSGIEYAFQSELSSAGGAEYGDQVFLTLDVNVQHILETIAEKTLQDNKAEAVMLLAMDSRSGDILGYASLPNFDPNDIRSSTEKERMDRPALWAYEPGSVFKVFSMASIMELGGINDQTLFDCNGKYERVLASGERIVIKCLGAHGKVSAKDIITYSCNAGAAYASDRVEAKAFADKIAAFGFGSKTGSGLPGETAGFIRTVDRWSARSKPTIAIGQELAVSALQMVQAATAIANDGILVKPRIVSRILASDGTLKKRFEIQAPRRVLSDETARAIRRYMVSAASEAGTGRRAKVDDLQLAVKTGTAQLINPETGTYSSSEFIASCMALLPADRPSLILYTVIVRPKGDSYLGGRIAAPPIGEAAEALADYLGMARGRNNTAVHSGSILLSAEDEITLSGTMPNLMGVSKRQLLPLLSRADLRIEIVGEGWVTHQSPEAGTTLQGGDSIFLELE